MKGNIKNLLFWILLFLIIVTVIGWETIKVNIIVFLTLRRGIISQNCFWWKVNDMFADSTGAEVYQSLKKDRFVKLNIFGKQIYLLTDIQDIQKLLDLSPNPFGPGLFKQNFFDSFMKRNVGISVNPDWKYKREYNDRVLETDRSHSMNQMFNVYIRESFQVSNPKNFEEFTELTRRLTSRIIFGTYHYNPIIYKIFKQADSFLSARFNVNTVNSEDLEEYRRYLRFELENPKPNTLLYLGHKHHSMLPIDDVIDQIPHWIFPIAGLFSVHLPRLLVMLANHPQELENVIQEIKETQFHTKESYTRKCILELFRLNNAVNSTFRGLTESFRFENSEIEFSPGTQFVFFNNPVLRDLFEHPNEYIPSRWSPELEESSRALMFNQGNQRCPGKELVISILTMGLTNYLEVNNYKIRTNRKLNPEFIPYILNPCTIEFY
jgi:hypothetical protein